VTIIAVWALVVAAVIHISLKITRSMRDMNTRERNPACTNGDLHRLQNICSSFVDPKGPPDILEGRVCEEIPVRTTFAIQDSDIHSKGIMTRLELKCHRDRPCIA
jgi:hypothetical protein